MKLTIIVLTEIENEIADLDLQSFFHKIEQLKLNSSKDELERYKKQISWSNQFKVNYELDLSDTLRGSLPIDPLETAEECMNGNSRLMK